ncbi:MAG: SDR family oxidoreductase [Coriobacteriia bacterium]|nr:SDR family oxidoreductase [Coriobacteriia bacterium]MCL2750336.1 SDR family oxidoreductase [Coriobacteriia bacterium]
MLGFNFKDQVVWITASGSGIGLAIAKRFAGEGAKLVICDIDKFALKDAKTELEELGAAEVLSVEYDASELSSIKKVFDTLMERFGRIDVLVNNAGVAGPTSPIQDVDPEAWDYTLAVNLRGPFYTIKLVTPVMKEQGGGRIVNIASQSGKVPLVNRTAYCSSKMGVIGLTRTVALELGRSNITVNAVCPGSVAGPRLDFVFEAVAQGKGLPVEMIKEIHYATAAIPEAVESSQVADAVLFLADKNLSSAITGIDLNVNNGSSMY